MKATSAQTKGYEQAGWMVEAVVRVTRPLIRLVMGKVSFKAMADIMRKIYLQEAQEYLRAKHPDQAVTNAGLAALSGLDSRMIKAVLERQDETYTRADLCVEANILETWTKMPLFQDKDGKPAELNIHGSGRSFQGLVWRAAGRAVTPPTVLDELVSNGNVEIDSENGRVRLVSAVYENISPSEKTMIDAGSLSLHRLGVSVCHNLKRTQDAQIEPWLQRDRWSVCIPRQAAPQLRKDLRALLTKHIQEVEDVLGAVERQLGKQDDDFTIGVGWYYWEGEAERAPKGPGTN